MQFKLRTLLLLVGAAGFFFGGYRLGLERGRRKHLDFDDLTRLIDSTLNDPKAVPRHIGGGSIFNDAEDPFAPKD